MKRILKALVVVGLLSTSAGMGTYALFTSSVSAANNVIQTGTLRLAIDSTRAHILALPHVWNGGNGGVVAPYDAYTIAQDVNGVSTQYDTLEAWLGAAPGAFDPYMNDAGADALQDGNHSYWVAFRNNGTISMKVSSNVTGGTWTMDPGVAATPTCSAFNPNVAGVVTVRNVHLYAADNCEAHEECENLYYALETGPWNYANTYSDGSALAAPVNIGNGTPVTGTVYATQNGTTATPAVQLDASEYVIARIDVNFDTTGVVPAAQENCYQGATFNYTLNGNAYQMTDGTW
ncbi:MAG TPA: SipW-dependent-type signal peptide-containing protein [Vitreimonas sp.]|nr:SipW-dependent-type signal peptide-containing protein [Vitreimonas sp.]